MTLPLLTDFLPFFAGAFESAKKDVTKKDEGTRSDR